MKSRFASGNRIAFVLALLITYCFPGISWAAIPSDAKLLSYIPRSTLSGIAISGKHIVTSNLPNTLTIIDDDPTASVNIVSSTTTDIRASKVFASDKYACIINGTTGTGDTFSIFDIADPKNIKNIATIRSDGPISSAYIFHNRIHVLIQGIGISTYTITSPGEVGLTKTTPVDNILSMKGHSNIIFASTSTRKVHILDTSETGNAEIKKTIEFNSNTLDVDYANGIIFCLTPYQLQIYDASNLNNPHALSTINFDTYYSSINCSDDNFILIGGQSYALGKATKEITQASISHFPLLGDTSAINKKEVFIGSSYTGTISKIDATNTSSPVTVYEIKNNLVSPPKSPIHKDGAIFSNKLARSAAFDITDLNNPKVATPATQSTEFDAYDRLSSTQTHVFASTQYYTDVYEVEDGGNTWHKTDQLYGTYQAIPLSDNYVITCSDSALYTYKINPDKSISLLSWHVDAGGCFETTTQGSIIPTHDYEKVYIHDFSSPENPKLANSVQLGSYIKSGIQIETHLYITTSNTYYDEEEQKHITEYNLHTIDISAPELAHATSSLLISKSQLPPSDTSTTTLGQNHIVVTVPGGNFIYNTSNRNEPMLTKITQERPYLIDEEFMTVFNLTDGLSIYQLTPETSTISASTDAGGTIFPSGDLAIPKGDQFSFVITPDFKYTTSDVLIDGASQGPISNYTFTDTATNHTIHATFKIANPASFTAKHISRIPNISPTKVKYSGNLVFIQINSGTVRVLDNSNEDNPVFVSDIIQLSDIADFTVEGNTFYCVDPRGNIHAIDVTNPATPVQLGAITGRFNNSYPNYSFIHANNKIVTAISSANITTASFVNPNSPYIIKDHNHGLSLSEYYPAHAAAFKNCIYIINNQNAFYIYSMAGNAYGQPKTIQTTLPTLDIKASKNFLYVESYRQIEAFSLNNPNTPTKISQFPYYAGLASSGIDGSHLAYYELNMIAPLQPGNNGAIHIIDASSNSIPTTMHKYEFPGTTPCISLNDKTIISINKFGQTKLYTLSEVLKQTKSIDADTNFTFLKNSDLGVSISNNVTSLNTHNPGNIISIDTKQLPSYETNGERSAVLLGNNALINGGTIAEIDLSNPLDIRQKTVFMPTHPHHTTTKLTPIRNKILTTQQGEILPFSRTPSGIYKPETQPILPQFPTSKETITSPSSAISIHNNTAYVVHNGRISSYNISEVCSPSKITTAKFEIPNSYISNFTYIKITHPYLLALDSGKIHIFDISNKTSPSYISALAIPQNNYIHSFDVSGCTLILLSSGQPLTFFNLSNIQSPQQIQASAGDLETSEFSIFENFIYAKSRYGIEIYSLNTSSCNVTSSAESGGGISPSGTFGVPYRGSKEYAITPQPGYVVDKLYLGNIPIRSSRHFVARNVAKDIQIRATFALDTTDVDGDGIPSWWELAHGLDPYNTQDGLADLDNDGLTSREEFELGTDCQVADSDGDGISDGWEIVYGLNPLYAADAELDFDNDGYTNLQEFLAGTDPESAASFPVGLPISTIFLLMH